MPSTVPRTVSANVRQPQAEFTGRQPISSSSPRKFAGASW
jgi:hypothetical protein